MAGKKIVFNASVFFGSPLFPADLTTTVTVTDENVSGLATLYSDRDGASKTNSFTISNVGEINFYIDPGRYTIVAVQGANSSTWSNVEIQRSVYEIEDEDEDFTLDSTYQNLFIETTGSNDIDILVPSNASDEQIKGFIVHIRHNGTGVCTIIEDTGVTVTPPDDGTLVIPTNGTVSLIYMKTTANVWDLFGQVVGS